MTEPDELALAGPQDSRCDYWRVYFAGPGARQSSEQAAPMGFPARRTHLQLSEGDVGLLASVVRARGAVPLPILPVRPTRHNEMTNQHQQYNNDGQPGGSFPRPTIAPERALCSGWREARESPQAAFKVVCTLKTVGSDGRPRNVAPDEFGGDDFGRAAGAGAGAGAVA